MKKGVMLVLLVAIGLWAVALGSANSALNDSDLNGYYEIHNCTELQNMSLNLTASYELANDINCSDTVNWNSGAGFVPVGNNSMGFSGNFSGKNYTISRLYIYGNNYQGLFYSIELGSNVYDIKFFSSYSGNGEGSMGTVAYNNTGLIRNIQIDNGTIRWGGSGAGGGVSYLNSGTIENCYFNGSFVTGGGTGGITGENSGVVNNSYSIGTMSCGFNCGGIASSNTGTIQNSYSSIAISVLVPGIGEGGVVADNSGTVVSSYYDNETTGMNDTGKGVGKLTSQMKNQSTYSGWDFNTVWYIGTSYNAGYPILRSFGYDISRPVITLFPVDNSTATSRIFIYNVSDDSAIANCSLILPHDTVNNTNLTAINVSENNNITYPGFGHNSLPVGSYTAYINCTDAYGFVGQSNTISFTVAAVSTGTTSGSSGGSSGSVVRTIASSTIANGFTSNYRGGDSIKFDVKNQTHTLKVNSLTNGVATVTVQSEPQVLALSEGDIKDVDLENDGVYDLQVSFVKYYTTGIASIKVQQIEKAYNLPVDDNVNNDSLVDDIVDVFDGDKESESSNLALILSILLVVLLVGAIVGYTIWYLVRRRRFEIVANS